MIKRRFYGDENMKVYNVYGIKNKTGVKELCVLNENNNYIGIKSGKVYSRNEYYHKKQLNAKIIQADEDNNTGMCHLFKEFESYEEENRKSWKKAFIGCYVTVEEAHYYGGMRVYRCLELEEYFSENELELL
jgi:hypothetical protein